MRPEDINKAIIMYKKAIIAITNVLVMFFAIMTITAGIVADQFFLCMFGFIAAFIETYFKVMALKEISNETKDQREEDTL